MGFSERVPTSNIAQFPKVLTEVRNFHMFPISLFPSVISICFPYLYPLPLFRALVGGPRIPSIPDAPPCSVISHNELVRGYYSG